MSRESFEAGYLDKLAELGGGMRRTITKAAAGRLPDYDKLSDDAVLQGWAKGTDTQRQNALRIAGIDADRFANTTDNAARAGLIRQAMKARAQANGLSVAARNAAVAAARSDGPRLGGAQQANLARQAVPGTAGSWRQHIVVRPNPKPTAVSDDLTPKERRLWGFNGPIPAGMTADQVRAKHRETVARMQNELVDVLDGNGKAKKDQYGKPVQRTWYADQLARADAYDAAAAKGWDEIRRIGAELAGGTRPGQNGIGLSYGRQMTYFANRDGYGKSPADAYYAATGRKIAPGQVAEANRRVAGVWGAGTARRPAAAVAAARPVAPIPAAPAGTKRREGG